MRHGLGCGICRTWNPSFENLHQRQSVWGHPIATLQRRPATLVLIFYPSLNTILCATIELTSTCPSSSLSVFVSLRCRLPAHNCETRKITLPACFLMQFDCLRSTPGGTTSVAGLCCRLSVSTSLTLPQPLCVRCYPHLGKPVERYNVAIEETAVPRQTELSDLIL